MDLRISGRKALVNGGSAGMGRGAVLALAREGVEVFVSARGEDRLLATCKEIAEATGAKVHPVVADHSSDAGRETILAACPDPDILVATCAPPPFTQDFRDVPQEEMERALNTALLSPIAYIKAVIDPMIARRWGRIVNISTGAAKYPAAMRVLSGPPRAALSNYCTAIAKEVAQHNVTINSVLPGMHLTPGIEDVFGPRAKASGRSYDEEIDAFVKAIRLPAGRFGNAEDFGAMVTTLCSEMANYITGQSIVIDGGVGNSTF
ncbi:SDR family oxidoreductase [Qipengyuania sp. DSG2-2]|uniref:SDR family oxidoreductase n=1 Tax=Qipengyuania sp. DGS2-2 TaxID=3349631 RepID=UPI0036D4262F